MFPKGGVHSIIEVGGYLNLPGWSLGPNMPILDMADIRDHIAKNDQYILAVGTFLINEIDPSSSKYSNLSKRWLTALNWLAEGCREVSDSVAIAKIATSLDVLSCGGKSNGILKMLTNLLDISSDYVVISTPNPRTLKNVVYEVYEEGRSQILHGNKFDRLEQFGRLRDYAFYLTSRALAEAAMRLIGYDGHAGDKVFQTIPKGR